MEKVIAQKNGIVKTLQCFLENNEYKSSWQYNRIEEKIRKILENADICYRSRIIYVSNMIGSLELHIKEISVNQADIDHLKKEYNELQIEVLRKIGLSNWDVIPYIDETVDENDWDKFVYYDEKKFFQKNKGKVIEVENIITQKNNLVKTLRLFLENNEYKSCWQYVCIEREIKNVLKNAGDYKGFYRICVRCISNTGEEFESKIVEISQHDIREYEYAELKSKALRKLGFLNRTIFSAVEEQVIVKSRQALNNYDKIKFFRENKEKLSVVESAIAEKNRVVETLQLFLKDNRYQSNCQYKRLENEIIVILRNIEDGSAYRIRVDYISPAGNNLGSKLISVNQRDVDRFKKDPSLLMSKTEYNQLMREQQKEALTQRQHEYYERVNDSIDYANDNKGTLFVKNSREQLDSLVEQLYDRTVNSIKKIRTIDSEEWELIHKFITQNKKEMEKVVGLNQRILAYYGSPEFSKIKETCNVLMNSQREFNEYIAEKVESISKFFGVRVVRNETINEDEYNYIRPYKKTITPFTAEVSATVFASAENNPMEYVVKNFYPNKKLYPEQIQKLCQLVEELQTLREAKKIIENYKMEYQQYIKDVPAFIMENDEAGFYSRLGFATIDESVLTVEYKFSYTSGGGMAKRTFDVPMTEETIAELIRVLESKLTAKAFAKEQRILMTKKLREYIKERDNYTCCICGNSTHVEPNLLLEIDHIVPVAKGGCTVENNLQTLCWKCNRAKSDKVVTY